MKRRACSDRSQAGTTVLRWACAAAICGASGLACDGLTAARQDAGAQDTGGDAATQGAGADAGSEGLSGPTCGATPTLLVDFQALVAQLGVSSYAAPALALDSKSIYFVFDDALMSVPIGGGPLVTMLQLPFPSNVVLQLAPVVNSTSVLLDYPTGGARDQQIVSVPIDGGSATNLTVSNGVITEFGADNQNLYFIDDDGAKSVPVGGGSVQLLTDQVTAANVTGSGGALAVVGSSLLATSSAQGGSVMAVPLQGGAPTTLATQQPAASFPMACGSDICWWTGSSSGNTAGSSGPGFIARLDASGNVTTLPQAPFFPWSLVFDGTDFFESVGCDVCDGSLVRIPAAGGPAVSMGMGSFIAVDASCAYWSSIAGISSALKSYAGP
jgi:hypothetical protein